MQKNATKILKEFIYIKEVISMKCPFRKLIKTIEKREDHDHDSHKKRECKIESVEKFGHCIYEHKWKLKT